MSTLFFGDVHFYSAKKYFVEAGYHFIDYVNNLKENTAANTAVFLGDLVENFVNDGIVFDQLTKLFEVMRFKHIYVLIGNHDIKHTKSGYEIVAYEFLRERKNVTFLEKPGEIVEIEGSKVLSLPHYNSITGFPPMYDYYSNLPGETLNQHYDYVLGHLTDSTLEVYGKPADLTKVKTDKFIFGHIHTRSNERYIGSVFALNPLQNGNDRAIWVLSDSAIWSEIKMPDFLHFYEVTFPEALPKESSNAVIPVYSIYDCHDESKLESLYGKIHIRQVNVKPKSLNAILQKEADFKTSAKFSKSGNFNDILNELVRASKGTYDRGAVCILRDLFSRPS